MTLIRSLGQQHAAVELGGIEGVGVNLRWFLVGNGMLVIIAYYAAKPELIECGLFR